MSTNNMLTSLFLLIFTVYSSQGCQIGPRKFGFDLSMFQARYYFRFEEQLIASVNMTRKEMMTYFKAKIAPMSSLYEYAVDDFILTIELGKVEAKFEIRKLKPRMSPPAYELANKIYALEINDDLTCEDRTNQIIQAVAEVPVSVSEEYQEERKKFEDHFNLKRQKVMILFDANY